MHWVDFAICLCFGYLGVHKFMEKKTVMGVLYLFTCGLFGIGWIYDCVVFFKNAQNGQRSITCKAAGFGGRQLADGEPLPVVSSGNVLLSADEICHYNASATHVKTKNAVIGYTGGNKGVSIRIAKGISYRVGASKSQPIRGNVQEQIPGTLTITNRRVVFSSVSGSFDKKITSLSALIPHNDGITLQFGEKQYSIMTREASYVYQIVTRIVSNS